MKNSDPALTFSNPRMLCAAYFGLLSVAATLLINAFLAALGIKDIVPLFQAVILGMVVASATGALFGERLLGTEKPYQYKAFWIGFLMVIASLPVFDLGLMYLMQAPYTAYFSFAQFQDIIFSYLKILLYSYLLFGIFLAIASGFAALYLRSQLVYDILYTDEKREKLKKQALKHHGKPVAHK